jgi:hypothetical protein
MGLSTGIGIGIGFNRGSQSWESYWSTRNPSGLFLIVDSTTQITLYWYNNGTIDYDDIRIESKVGAGFYSELSTEVNGTLMKVVIGLTADTTYSFRLRYKKGTEYSAYSNEVTETTFLDVATLAPFVWLKSDAISQVDLTDLTTWTDSAGSNNFAATTSSYYSTFRNLPVPYVINKTSVRQSLRKTFTSKDLSVFELYLVFFPGYDAASKIKSLFGFRDSETELLQSLELITTGEIRTQFRTSGNSIKTMDISKHARRFNILHVIYDKPNNLVTSEIDGVQLTTAYNFGVETLRSTLLSLMGYFLSTGDDPEDAIPTNYGFTEFIAAFDTALVSSRTKLYSYLDKKYNIDNGSYSTNKTIAELVAATPVLSDYFDPQDVYDLVITGAIAQYDIQTTDNPQTIFNAAPAGSLLRFKTGTHIHATGTNRSILYCDKPMYIELEAGAVLKLADNSNTLDLVGELVTNQGTNMVLNDFSYRGTYSGSVYADILIQIDTAAATDKFSWGVGEWVPGFTATGVSITGDWQTLGTTGIDIKFNATTGHALTNQWIIAFAGTSNYGIRIGTGFHTNYINDVTVFGAGIIDMNDANQIPSSQHSFNLQSGFLIHGRCKNVNVYSIVIQNCHRGIMAYGDNNGTYLPSGKITGGTDFNCKDIKIVDVTINNDFATGSEGCGILLGHPEHRGGLFNVICNLNTIASYWNGIELNFRMYNYECRNNHVRSSHTVTTDIALWRENINGVVVNNNAVLHAPDSPYYGAGGGWEIAKNIYSTANARA